MPKPGFIEAQEGDPSSTLGALWMTRTQDRARLKIPA